jgi:hypothetical protein
MSLKYLLNLSVFISKIANVNKSTPPAATGNLGFFEALNNFLVQGS